MRVTFIRQQTINKTLKNPKEQYKNVTSPCNVDIRPLVPRCFCAGAWCCMFQCHEGLRSRKSKKQRFSWIGKMHNHTAREPIDVEIISKFSKLFVTKVTQVYTLSVSQCGGGETATSDSTFTYMRLFRQLHQITHRIVLMLFV